MSQWQQFINLRSDEGSWVGDGVCDVGIAEPSSRARCIELMRFETDPTRQTAVRSEEFCWLSEGWRVDCGKTLHDVGGVMLQRNQVLVDGTNARVVITVPAWLARFGPAESGVCQMLQVSPGGMAGTRPLFHGLLEYKTWRAADPAAPPLRFVATALGPDDEVGDHAERRDDHSFSVQLDDAAFAEGGFLHMRALSTAELRSLLNANLVRLGLGRLVGDGPYAGAPRVRAVPGSALDRFLIGRSTELRVPLSEDTALASLRYALAGRRLLSPIGARFSTPASAGDLVASVPAGWYATPRALAEALAAAMTVAGEGVEYEGEVDAEGRVRLTASDHGRPVDFFLGALPPDLDRALGHLVRRSFGVYCGTERAPVVVRDTPDLSAGPDGSLTGAATPGAATRPYDVELVRGRLRVRAAPSEPVHGCVALAEDGGLRVSRPGGAAFGQFQAGDVVCMWARSMRFVGEVHVSVEAVDEGGALLAANVEGVAPGAELEIGDGASSARVLVDSAGEAVVIRPGEGLSVGAATGALVVARQGVLVAVSEVTATEMRVLCPRVVGDGEHEVTVVGAGSVVGFGLRRAAASDPLGVGRRPLWKDGHGWTTLPRAARADVVSCLIVSADNVQDAGASLALAGDAEVDGVLAVVDPRKTPTRVVNIRASRPAVLRAGARKLRLRIFNEDLTPYRHNGGDVGITLALGAELP